MLVVEDDGPLRDAILEVLAADGYSVLSAVNGVEGLRLLRNGQPDIVLLDLVMPVMSGWEFMEEKRRDAAVAGVPVVVLSAASQARAAALQHAVEFIRKPFEVEALLNAVTRHAPPA